MRLISILVPTLFLTGCLNATDLSGICSPADRADPTSRCYCFSSAERDRIRPYDNNAPPAYETEAWAPEARDSLYDGSTVTPAGGGALRRGPAVIGR